MSQVVGLANICALGIPLKESHFSGFQSHTLHGRKRPTFEGCDQQRVGENQSVSCKQVIL